ncbi:MAG TPA: RNA polymerase sigma factor [Bacteroidaceae bacterium]|nr:RNA polymerase sigma factor [Bacteroidaceae bacterium]
MTVEEYNNAVDQHADNLYRFILKNVKVEDTARDIVQDAFEKLWIKIERVDGEKVKSYLFTAAYHTMIDYIRKENRLETMDESKTYGHYHEEQYSDIREVLNRAFENLPEVQRSVLMLRDYEGYSYQEIAEITNLSESQVKVYIYRARVYLKTYIGNPERII